VLHHGVDGGDHEQAKDRSVVVRGLIESLGGKFEGFWLAFGEYDFVGIAQLGE
jgi:uncharacterized protein with GYD domain